MPAKPTYEFEKLAEFIAGDDDPVFVFYGGEPLLNRPYVCRVMDRFPDATFVLQSNCTLLYDLPTPTLRDSPAYCFPLMAARKRLMLIGERASTKGLRRTSTTPALEDILDRSWLVWRAR